MRTQAHHEVDDTPRRIRLYRSFAEALNVAQRPARPALEVLLAEMPEPQDPHDQLAVAARGARVWLEEGEDPPLCDELRALFGDGFCRRSLPQVPACGAFYVDDARSARDELNAVYADLRYERIDFTSDCDGVTFISQQLAFAAHCLENGSTIGECGKDASVVLHRSLFDWAPLFARALVNSTKHPAARFTGLMLEDFLDSEVSADALLTAR